MTQILSGPEIDSLLDNVLKASGSGLRHYSLPGTLSLMRATIQAVENAVIKALGEETETPMTELWDPEHQCPGHTQDTLVAYGIEMFAKGLTAASGVKQTDADEMLDAAWDSLIASGAHPHEFPSREQVREALCDALTVIGGKR